MQLFYITGNPNKVREAQLLLPEITQLDIDLPEIQDIDPHAIIKHKLLEAGRHHQGAFIVEDVSFVMHCLNGLPGPLIKWFIKTIGISGIYRIAAGHNDFRATVSANLGYRDEHGQIHYFEGKVEGKIVSPRGESNFGFDPIFQPSGHAKTYAQMATAEKNQVSHRSLAFRKLRDHLATEIG